MNELEELLRVSLWLSHGCNPGYLTAFNGQYRCSRCHTNFTTIDAKGLRERFDLGPYDIKHQDEREPT